MIMKIGRNKFRIDFHPQRHGPRIRRTVKGTRPTAERVLLELHRRALAMQFGWPTPAEVTVGDLADLVVKDYERNSRGSVRTAKIHHAFWVSLCGGKLAESLADDMLTGWADEWARCGATAATINRRMSFLLRGYSLAKSSKPPLLAHSPTWKKLRERNPRSGFREWEEFVQIREALPLHARCPVTIDYWTGMRPGEVFGLRWQQVRFDHNEQMVFIQLSDTKNAEPRIVAMGGDLYTVLHWWQALTQQVAPGCQWVCHRNGKQLKSLKTSWKNACVKLGIGRFTKPDKKYATQRGYVGPLLADFRRTGVRNLVRAGVPDKIALKISGHKTREVFERYNIVNEQDLIQAGKSVVEYHRKKSEKVGKSSMNNPGDVSPENDGRSKQGGC